MIFSVYNEYSASNFMFFSLLNIKNKNNKSQGKKD